MGSFQTNHQKIRIKIFKISNGTKNIFERRFLTDHSYQLHTIFFNLACLHFVQVTNRDLKSRFLQMNSKGHPHGTDANHSNFFLFISRYRSEEHTSELPVTPISRMPSS